MSDEKKETSATPDNQQAEASSVSDSQKTENATLSKQVARRWLQALAWLINFIVPTIISILLGFSPLPQSVPVISIMQHHPLISLMVCGVLALVTVYTLLILYKPKTVDAVRKLQWHVTGNSRPWIIVTALSMISTVLSLSLLLVVLLRPSWCPNTLCPSPQILTHPGGIHDASLDLYPIAIQSTSFAIPGNPASYSESNVPKSIGAVRLDMKQASSYRVVLGVQSLQQGRFGVIFEQIALVVEQVPPMPHPLNVWNPSTLVGYNTNSYQVNYSGQTTGAALPATYTSILHGFLELAPGEPDQFNVQISTRYPVDIRFRVQVTYRVTNESETHVLTLPLVYEVMFSDASNWHEYQFQNGHFVPNP
jgi:hypothetical protein